MIITLFKALKNFFLYQLIAKYWVNQNVVHSKHNKPITSFADVFENVKQKNIRMKNVANVRKNTVDNSFDNIIENISRKYNINPLLTKAVIKVESNFNPRAVSGAGAMGLMQLMPGTAREVGIKKPFDPEENIEGGVKYLRQMMDRFGNLELALAAYNAGPGAVQKYSDIPPYRETQRYVTKVISELKRLDQKI